ncbi:MAG: O-antigen ligase family protein, partial [Chloroflexi bacterium]|nr:O-antigen ligase family protein [Chloroflexota bacterium]
MNSCLAILCEKILESGWLAALIVAPLYFDVYSSRVFEPDKIALVRSLALAMIGAWVILRVELGFPRVGAWRDYLRANPLLFSTLVIVAVYLVATITSLVPQISFWGSYQRLEGTYTTFAYIAIFLIAISALRTRAQLERALNVILVTSFPIAFYGIIQHFQLDPLPWGGDTVLRVASNMGNSIFVAAYLIMIVPLTLARWLAPHSPNDNRAETRARILFFCALVILAALWVYDFTLGTLFALALYLLAIIFARVTRSSVRAAIWRATHTLILAAQLVAIFFTQSRGPWVGLAAGLFAFAILYPLARGVRRIALAAISFALVGVAVLLIFNLPNSPLDQLKRVPYIGRLGQIFETESGTGKVRELIWQGALQAIAPHAPLWSPTTGDDALNLIRPLIGYGPEAMYVAFNPFYPPELAHLEARNASPDRSHNETFDALVMTGLVGFAANILLFISVFYFGLKWLGIIETRAQRNAFIALWFAGGFVSALAFGVARGWNFIGVALPTGMIAGFFVFLIARAIFSRPGENANEVNGRALWLCALIAALLAHFIEIHFGIAIVSTREYFWFYAALLVVIGLDRLRAAARPPTLAPQVATARSVTRRRKQRNAQPRAQFQPAPEKDAPALSEILMWTAIAVIILLTLIFEFFNNQTGTENVLEAVRQSLFLKLNG